MKQFFTKFTNFLIGKYQAFSIVLDLDYESTTKQLGYRSDPDQVYKLGKDRFFLQKGFQIQLGYKSIKILPNHYFLSNPLCPYFEGEMKNEGGKLKLEGHFRIKTYKHFSFIIWLIPMTIGSIHFLISSELNSDYLLFWGGISIYITIILLIILTTLHYLNLVMEQLETTINSIEE